MMAYKPTKKATRAKKLPITQEEGREFSKRFAAWIDKHRGTIAFHAQGGTLQVQTNPPDGLWESCGIPRWNMECNYRPTPAKKHRPYSSRLAQRKLLGKIVQKVGSISACKVIYIGESQVVVSNPLKHEWDYVSYRELAECWVFVDPDNTKVDGVMCGVPYIPNTNDLEYKDPMEDEPWDDDEEEDDDE